VAAEGDVGKEDVRHRAQGEARNLTAKEIAHEERSKSRRGKCFRQR